MMNISFVTFELLFTAVWLAVRMVVWIRQKRIIWKREALLLLMYINLAVIIRFSFFPRDLVNRHIQPLVFDAKAAFPFRINYVPFCQFASIRQRKRYDLEYRREYGDVYSDRNHFAYRLQKAGSFRQGDRGGSVHITMYRVDPIALCGQSFGC